MPNGQMCVAFMKAVSSAACYISGHAVDLSVHCLAESAVCTAALKPHTAVLPLPLAAPPSPNKANCVQAQQANSDLHNTDRG